MEGHRMQTTRRNGEHLRVAAPGWANPLDGSYSMRLGGRWNAPGTFPVTYLSADMATARANARHFLTRRLARQPFSADDLEISELPVLVSVVLPDAEHLDAATADGCQVNGLPTGYPLDDG